MMFVGHSANFPGYRLLLDFVLHLRNAVTAIAMGRKWVLWKQLVFDMCVTIVRISCHFEFIPIRICPPYLKVSGGHILETGMTMG